MANSKLRTELISGSTHSRKSGLQQNNNKPGIPSAANMIDPVFKYGTSQVEHFAAKVVS